MVTAAIETSKVVFEDNQVAKCQGIGATRRELEGTRFARSIADRCGLFSVPRVITSNTEEGIIVFERIKDADTLRRLLPGVADPEELVARTADILARIHDESIDGRSFVHGDFTIENVLYSESQGELAVIDWSAPRWFSSTGEVRPEHDVAMFLISLFNRPVFYSKRIRKVQDLGRHFLASYSDKRDLDTIQLADTSQSLLAQYLPYYRQKAFVRFVANYPSIRRFKRFVLSL